MTESPEPAPAAFKPMSRVIAILHPGQMGAAIGSVLRGRRHTVLWCAADRSRETTQRARDAGLTGVRKLDELVSRADVILSICPASAAEEVATSVAEQGYRGLYIEANGIAPSRFDRIAATLTAGGATVLDASITGLPPGLHSVTHLYLAGPAILAGKVAGLFSGTGVDAVHVGERLGAASALKMAHVSYQRSARALAGVAHALAADYDVTAHLLAEAERKPRSTLADPEYLIKVAARAARSLPELDEAAVALADADLPPGMAVAAAEVMSRWVDGIYRPGTPVDEVLAGLRTQDPADG